jgi:hypothetical protein
MKVFWELDFMAIGPTAFGVVESPVWEDMPVMGVMVIVRVDFKNGRFSERPSLRPVHYGLRQSGMGASSPELAREFRSGGFRVLTTLIAFSSLKT